MSADSRRGVVAWLRLARAYHAVARAAAAQLKPIGLSMAQFDVLAQVGAREGLTQQQLSDVLLVTKGNVCQLLDRMESGGWIDRRPSGRTNCLYLTEPGRELFDLVVPAHEQRISKVFGVLGPGEQRELAALARKVERGLAKVTPPPGTPWSTDLH